MMNKPTQFRELLDDEHYDELEPGSLLDPISEPPPPLMAEDSGYDEGEMYTA